MSATLLLHIDQLTGLSACLVEPISIQVCNAQVGQHECKLLREVCASRILCQEPDSKAKHDPSAIAYLIPLCESKHPATECHLLCRVAMHANSNTMPSLHAHHRLNWPGLLSRQAMHTESAGNVCNVCQLVAALGRTCSSRPRLPLAVIGSIQLATWLALAGTQLLPACIAPTGSLRSGSLPRMSLRCNCMTMCCMPPYWPPCRRIDLKRSRAALFRLQQM